MSRVGIKPGICALNVYALQLPLNISHLLILLPSEKIDTSYGHLGSECCCEVQASVHTDNKFITEVDL